MSSDPVHHLPYQSAHTKYLLIAGFATSLLILVVLTAIGLSYMYNNLSRINQIVDTNNVKIQLLREMHNSARERSLLLHMMLDTQDPFSRDELFLKFIQYGAKFARARIAYSKMGLSDLEKRLLAEQGKVSGIAVPVQRQIVDLIQHEHYAMAQTILNNRAVPMQDTVLGLLTRLQQMQEEASVKTATQSKRDLQSLVFQSFFLVVLGALIGIFIAARVIRRITQTERYLLFEKRLAEVTLHSIGEAIITTDIHARITHINPVAESLTG